MKIKSRRWPLLLAAGLAVPLGLSALAGPVLASPPTARAATARSRSSPQEPRTGQQAPSLSARYSAPGRLGPISRIPQRRLPVTFSTRP
jgi:hypothetical protein